MLSFGKIIRLETNFIDSGFGVASEYTVTISSKVILLKSGYKGNQQDEI
jgi:hypothetical protein